MLTMQELNFCRGEILGHRVRLVINRQNDQDADVLVRPATDEDPTRRGQRKFKRAIVEIKRQLTLSHHAMKCE